MAGCVVGEERTRVDRVGLWQDMLRLRAYDERAFRLSRQGRIGGYPMFWGEEAIQAAAVAATDASDWLFLSYRQNGLPILRGLPPELGWLYFRGDPQAFFDPAEYGCAPQCVPLATHLPHAVGWAHTRSRHGHDDVAVAFFGDGATSEGDFHEALNLAGVLGAPVVFLCTNNGWAISTPFAQQTAAERLVDRAAGYGLPGEHVDGFDALAVLDVVTRAVERARGGGGPTLVEATCYRILGHATPDEPRLYRDEQEAARWREREPVGALRETLVGDGALTEEEADDLRAQAEQEMADAARRLDAIPAADPRTMISDVLADVPDGLRRQYDAARERTSA